MHRLQATQNRKQSMGIMNSQKSATPTVAKVRTLQIAVFTHPSADKVNAGTKQANSVKTLSVDAFESGTSPKGAKGFFVPVLFFSSRQNAFLLMAS